MIDALPAGPRSLVAGQAANRTKLLLTTVVVAFAALLWQTGAAAAATTQTVTIASGSPTVVVSGLKKGDTVDVVATLNTSDVNENGEGEPLVLQGALSVTISSY